MDTDVKILNFGSLNIDYVYNVSEFVRPGETISAMGYHRFPGGKGLNQSIALARAGLKVIHAGKIGADGRFLKELLEAEAVDCSGIEVAEAEASGHAMIQVAASGENCIVLYGGTNQTISSELVESVLKRMKRGDFLLLQNEISSMKEIMEQAAMMGLRIFLNPAPMTPEVLSYPLEKVETLIVNETEGATLCDMPCDTDCSVILKKLRTRFPKLNLLMTLGAQGAVYCAAGTDALIRVAAEKVEKVVDTTAAGDTFIGYFLSGIARGKSPEESMKIAAKASAVCVGRAGAGVSIPCYSEL